MTERVETVRLTAIVTNYLANMELASKSTTKVGDTATAAAVKQKAASEKIGTAAVAMGAVAAAGVAIAISKFADFDAKMSQVQALSHATGDEMKALSDAALHAGQAIGFSASDVADAETEMVKAGISVKDILGGALPGALQLAAAGQIDVADATEIATIAMTQFGLKGQDIPHVADLLTAGADKALGGVQDLGDALKSGGLVASQFGVSLDETVGTLSAFANAGLIGETAGTDLRQMLLKLANPAADAQKAMSQLGISIYGANGDFVGITDLAGELKNKMTDLDPATRNAALATIFGSRAIAGANVLYKEGAKGIQSWVDQVDDSGFAAKQAAAKMDNLKGDISKLGAAFDTDLIESGSNANGILRGLTQGATGVVTAIGNLSGPVLAVGLGVTALAAGTLLLGGGFLTLVPKVMATRAAMAELQITGVGLAKGFGKGGAVLLAVSALVSAFTNTGSSAELAADKLAQVDAVSKNLTKDNLNKLFKDAGDAAIDGTAKTDKFKESLNAVASGNFWTNESGIAKFVDGATFGLSHLSDVYKTNEAQFKELGKNLADTTDTDFDTATKGFAKLVDAAGGGKEAIRQLLDQMPDYKAKLVSLAADQGVTLKQSDLFNLSVGKGSLAQQIGSDTAAKLATATAGIGQAASDASGDISDLEDSISNFNKVQFTADDAMSAFHQSFLDIETAMQATTIDAQGNKVKTFTGTLDQNTQEGIDNASMLRDLADKTNDAAAKTLDLNGNVDDANAVLADGRAKLESLGSAFGLSGDALQTFIDTYVESPKDLTYQASIDGLEPAQKKVDDFFNTNQGRQVKADFGADTTSAQAAVDAFVLKNNNKQISLQVAASDFGSNNNSVVLAKLLNANSGHARGGIIPGSPSARDNRLTPMASGEFVNNAASTAIPQNRAALEYMNNGGNIANYQPAPPAPMYLQSPSAAATRSGTSGPMAIQGTLDLGNGLTGYVKGVLMSEMSSMALDVNAGGLS